MCRCAAVQFDRMRSSCGNGGAGDSKIDGVSATPITPLGTFASRRRRFSITLFSLCPLAASDLFLGAGLFVFPFLNQFFR